MTPKRLCIACRESYPRDRLHRLVYSSVEDAFSFNDTPPLQGRSAYVCASVECVRMALKSKKFQKALKRPIPDVIVETLGNLLN